MNPSTTRTRTKKIVGEGKNFGASARGAMPLDRAKRMVSKPPESSAERLKKKTTGSEKKMPELVGPVNTRKAIRAAFYEAQDEKIKKRVEGKRTIRNGSGSSHGF